MLDSHKYGPWAVIAGGSEAVGAAMARQLAQAGINSVIIARKPEPLAQTAEEVRALGAEVITIQQDLLAPDALDRVRAVTDDLDIGLFIHNAGTNTYRSPYVDSDPVGVQGVLDLNITAPLAFIRHYGSRLRDRGRGGIVVVGSLGGLVGYHTVSVYAAAKAFLRIFVEGIWYELKPHGVDVLELCLGLTRTPAMERLGANFDAPGLHAADPDDVAREGLEHLGEGPSWIAGGNYDLAVHQTRWPRREVIEEIAQRYRKVSNT